MIGLATAAAVRGLDPDLEPLASALRAHVADGGVEIAGWDDPSIDWSRLDLVILRSTWDYARRLDEFLGWLDRVDAVSHVVNRPGIVRWNSDKHYLQDLAGEGIPIVPTTFVEPGSQAPTVVGVHVVKPAIGAGSDGARRCASGDVADHVAALHRSGRTAMVQPYLDLLDDRGETAQCFVASQSGGLEFSHAFKKSAILAGDEVQLDAGLIAPEVVTSCTPSAAERALAERVLSTESLTERGDVWYARVDTVPVRDGGGRIVPAVAEIELIEPSFYFHLAPGSADRFAARILDRFAAPVPEVS